MSEAFRQKLALDRTLFPEGVKVKPVPGSRSVSAASSKGTAPVYTISDDSDDEGHNGNHGSASSASTPPTSSGAPSNGAGRPNVPLYQTAQGTTKPLFGGATQTDAIEIRDTPPPPYRSTVPQNPLPKSASQTAQPDPDGETVDVNIQVEYEVKGTAEDAQKAMRDLVSSAMSDIKLEEVDMTQAIVDGFQPTIRLMPHQIQGRAWMRERETGKKTGGILADDMGLGKTIQTLARIVEGRPSKADLKGTGYCKTTLIVAPNALLGQWVSEVEKMTVGLKVMSHHGPDRERDPDRLARYDIVVTTYSTLASELANKAKDVKGPSKSKSKKKDEDSDEANDSDDSAVGKILKKKKAAPKKKAPPAALHQLSYWRVVLDEAQNIKNRTTKAALACFDLKSKYRWCLTGTPIQNNVDDIFPLIAFLRIRPLNQWDNFRETISKPVKAGKSKNAMKRLHIVLSATMLRRTKDQTLDGKPLITLPPRTVDVISCIFDDDERAFYEAMEAKTSLTMNKFIAKGTVMANYTSVLILLLRLRQATNHPSLVAKDFTKDMDALQSKAPPPPGANEDEEGQQEVDELADIMGSLGLAGKAKCSLCQDDLDKDAEGGFCAGCARDVIKTSRRKSIAVSSPRKSIVRKYDSDTESDEENSSLPPTSTKIRKLLEILKMISEREDKPTEDDDDDEAPKPKKAKRAREKTIVFSQFTSFLDLVEPFLTNAGIQFARYDGSMNPKAREAALERIKTQPKVTVILISFKAGGVGLNLTECNNVILMDLWWNPALEDQAFDRAHRLGQTRPVYIYKLTVEKTVEARILELQNVKRELAKAAYSGGKINRGGLGLEDILKIFDRRTAGDDDEADESFTL